MQFLFLLLVVFAKPSFVRMTPVSFDTAISHYRSKQVQVDLVGAVHVGEAAYYGRLNQLFKKYDVVLYELIAQPPGDPNREELYDIIGMKAPRSNPVPVKGRTDTETTSFQRQLCEKLGLQFQLDEIDYQAANFRHADITPYQLQKLLEGHRETPAQILKRLLAGADTVMLFTSKPTPASRSRLRRFMAKTLLDPASFDQAVNGAEASAYLIKRNEKALKVLREELKKGHTRVAIFYGAAHMPDLASHLVKDFHLRLQGQDWQPAFHLKTNI